MSELYLFTWLDNFYFKWSLGYVNTVHKIGTTFSHHKPQMLLCDKFERKFGVYQTQSGQVSATVDNTDSAQCNGESRRSEITEGDNILSTKRYNSLLFCNFKLKKNNNIHTKMRASRRARFISA